MKDKLSKKAVLIEALTELFCWLVGYRFTDVLLHRLLWLFFRFMISRGYRSARFCCSSALRIFFIPEKRCDELT